MQKKIFSSKYIIISIYRAAYLLKTARREKTNLSHFQHQKKPRLSSCYRMMREQNVFRNPGLVHDDLQPLL